MRGNVNKEVVEKMKMRENLKSKLGGS